MRDRAQRSSHDRHDNLNRGSYGRDFGPEGAHRFAQPRDEGGQENWTRRGRTSGGFGSQYDAWSSGAGFHPEEDRLGNPSDNDWQPTRPARGRGAWAGDWERSAHYGRGPKNYRRTDERIREDVCEQLTMDAEVDATDIEVEVKDGEVYLSGEVASRQEKRRAAECVEHLPGVRDVFNRLRIAGHGTQEQTGRR